MSTSSSSSILSSQQNKRIRYAVLLVHTGGPTSQSWFAMWRHLSVKFAVESAPWKWLSDPFIRFLIAPFHVSKAQQLHQSMWVMDGKVPEREEDVVQLPDTSSPLPEEKTDEVGRVSTTTNSNLAVPQQCMPSVFYVTRLAQTLQRMAQRRLSRYPNVAFQVECAFAYQPDSIEQALQRFLLQGDGSRGERPLHASSVREEHLIILPLLPQYSSAITSFIYRKALLSKAVLQNTVTPHVHFLSRYGSNPHYILALERHVRQAFFVSRAPEWLFVIFPLRRMDDLVYRCECFRTFVYLQRVLQKNRTSSTSQQGSPRDANQVDKEEDSSVLGASQLSAGRVPAIVDYWGDDTSMYPDSFPKTQVRLVFLTQNCIRAAMNVEETSHSVRHPTIVTDAPPERFSLQHELTACYHHTEKLSPTNFETPGVGETSGGEVKHVKVSLFAPGSVVEDPGSKSMSSIMPLMKNLWGEAQCLPPLNDSQLHSEFIMELLSAWIKL